MLFDTVTSHAGGPRFDSLHSQPSLYSVPAFIVGCYSCRNSIVLKSRILQTAPSRVCCLMEIQITEAVGWTCWAEWENENTQFQ
jgi:hypothetical protein